MEWLTSVWVAIEPFMDKIFNFLVSSGIGAAVSLYVIRRWERRHQDDTLAQDVSTQVASNLINNDIMVSLESINREQIEQMKTEILTKFGNSLDTIALQTVLVGDIARVMLRFKAATSEEKEAILNDLATLTNVTRESLSTRNSEPIRINVAPISTAPRRENQNIIENDDLDLF